MDPEISRLASEAVDVAKTMGKTLDYSEASLEVVEELIAMVSHHADLLDEDARELVAQRFGCYLLAVGFKTYGGRLLWHDDLNQPVLVVGEPQCRIAVATWSKVLGRLMGDEADHLPFFWEGFSSRARQLEAGSDVLLT